MGTITTGSSKFTNSGAYCIFFLFFNFFFVPLIRITRYNVFEVIKHLTQYIQFKNKLQKYLHTEIHPWLTVHFAQTHKHTHSNKQNKQTNKERNTQTHTQANIQPRTQA